jgi:hypothetical protein
MMLSAWLNQAMSKVSIQRLRDQDARSRLAGSVTTNLGKETSMLRIILITVLLCACETVFAQELTAEQRSACMGDYQKYCKGTVPGGGRIIACLAKSNDKLTAQCQKVLADAQKK